MTDFLYTIFRDVINQSFNIDDHSMQNFHPITNGLVLSSDTKNLPQSLRDDVRELVLPFIGDIKNYGYIHQLHLKVQSKYSEIQIPFVNNEIYILDIVCNNYLGYDIESQGGTIVNKGNAILFKASSTHWECFTPFFDLHEAEDEPINVLRFVLIKE